MTLRAPSVSQPMTTRSGLVKSSSAAPSFKNSGLLTTSKVCLVLAAMAARTFLLVPTGTVLLSTTVLWPSMCVPIASATAST